MENIEDIFNEDLTSSREEGQSFSKVYKVVKGGFDIDGVETYLGSAPVSHLADNIQVFEKLTEDKSWPVSSIIQRDVDDRRVNEIANDFILKTSNNVKYFPPIVVAVVPRESNEEISKSYKITNETPESVKLEIFNKGGYSDKLEDRFKTAQNLSTLEGFYVLDFLNGIAQFPLCWDKSSIYAIVIDGQHRLEALKKAMKKNSDVGNYSQDIVFLDLSKKAKKEGRSPVEAIRRVFIDINYNAKPVTNARRTLMDDKDLSSLIVQSLVNDDDENGERKGRYLLPQIVDWYSENLKHSFPQLTGVLVLQQLIEDNFLQGANLVSISDLRKSNRVSRFVSNLNSKFNVDELIRTKKRYQGISRIAESYDTYKASIENQSDNADKEDLLFSMDYNVLNVARDSFEEIYSKSVVKFFNDFSPYNKALKILKKNSVFDNKDIRHRLIVRNPKKFSNDEREIIEELSSEMHNELNLYYLCYTVLGQKAFFRHYYKELVRHLQTHELNESSVLEFTEKWLEKMNLVVNSLHSTGIFKSDQQFAVSSDILQERGVTNYGSVAKSFWQGIIYNEQSIVYNNQGIEGFLGVIDYLYKSFPIRRIDNEEIVFPDDTAWFNISYSPKRIRNKIKQEYSDFDSTEIDDISDKIWSTKLDFLKLTISNL